MIRTRVALEVIPGYVPGRSAEVVAAERGLDDVVKLASNEAPFGPLPAARAAVADAIAGLNRYPDDRSTRLVDALAAHYGVDGSQVLLGAGSVDLCRLAFVATVDAGDEVVFGVAVVRDVPDPVATGRRASRCASRCRSRGTTSTRWRTPSTDATTLVFVCNPNNPTGTAIDTASLARFLERVPSDRLVVLDEAYREFVTGDDVPDGLDVLAAHENVVVLRTFSKAYGLAALRVGYAIGHPEVIGALRKVAMPFRVNALAQVAALASLGAHDEMRERVDEVIGERERLQESLADLGLSVPRSEANFVWLDVPDAAAALGEFSERHGVVMRVFRDVGVRVTVGTADENDRVVKVLQAALAEGVL